jgi:hypothetical protein
MKYPQKERRQAATKNESVQVLANLALAPTSIFG